MILKLINVINILNYILFIILLFFGNNLFPNFYGGDALVIFTDASALLLVMSILLFLYNYFKKKKIVKYLMISIILNLINIAILYPIIFFGLFFGF